MDQVTPESSCRDGFLPLLAIQHDCFFVCTWRLFSYCPTDSSGQAGPRTFVRWIKVHKKIIAGIVWFMFVPCPHVNPKQTCDGRTTRHTCSIPTRSIVRWLPYADMERLEASSLGVNNARPPPAIWKYRSRVTAVWPETKLNMSPPSSGSAIKHGHEQNFGSGQVQLPAEARCGHQSLLPPA